MNQNKDLILDEKTLLALIKEKKSREIEFFFDNLSSFETGRFFSRLDSEEKQVVLKTLSFEKAANLIELIPETVAAEILEEMDPKDAAPIVSLIESNQRADIVSEIDHSAANSIIHEMDPEEANDLKFLSGYSPFVAGGLMITEYLWHYESEKVSDIINDLRTNQKIYSDFDVQYVYVVNSDKILTGVLRLRDLLVSPGIKTAKDIMINNPVKIDHNTPLAELDDFFEKTGFIGAPVVDSKGKLIGVIKESDVDEALIDKNDETYLKTHGIIGGEELRSMPLFKRTTRRFSWLLVNIFFNIIAAGVITAYEDTLAQVIALAVFLPIISDMSGNTGTQALAVSLRELDLGLIKPREIFRVWRQEVLLGVINGAALGVVLGGAAYLWKQNLYLGLVIASAMSLNSIIAVSLGGTIPLFFKLIKVDPALASGPVLTTITDMCGFFLVLSFATAMLSYLT
ncbi:MAG: magnesium transporter [Desulforegulaceae bacterium]|nr:magnesium transporter [Desulforegulaceae bacterium]